MFFQNHCVVPVICGQTKSRAQKTLQLEKKRDWKVTENFHTGGFALSGVETEFPEDIRDAMLLLVVEIFEMMSNLLSVQYHTRARVLSERLEEDIFKTSELIDIGGTNI